MESIPLKIINELKLSQQIHSQRDFNDLFTYRDFLS
jgi:hypothetical protein